MRFHLSDSGNLHSGPGRLELGHAFNLETEGIENAVDLVRVVSGKVDEVGQPAKRDLHRN